METGDKKVRQVNYWLTPEEIESLRQHAREINAYASKFFAEDRLSKTKPPESTEADDKTKPA